MQFVKPNKCYFCGHEKLKVCSKITESLNYKGEETATASVRCNKCHARGPTVSYTQKMCSSYMHLHDDKESLEYNRKIKEEASNLAIAAWNDLKGLK